MIKKKVWEEALDEWKLKREVWGEMCVVIFYSFQVWTHPKLDTIHLVFIPAVCTVSSTLYHFTPVCAHSQSNHFHFLF